MRRVVIALALPLLGLPACAAILGFDGLDAPHAPDGGHTTPRETATGEGGGVSDGGDADEGDADAGPWMDADGRGPGLPDRAVPPANLLTNAGFAADGGGCGSTWLTWDHSTLAWADATPDGAIEGRSCKVCNSGHASAGLDWFGGNNVSIPLEAGRTYTTGAWVHPLQNASLTRLTIGVSPSYYCSAQVGDAATIVGGGWTEIATTRPPCDGGPDALTEWILSADDDAGVCFLVYDPTFAAKSAQ